VDKNNIMAHQDSATTGIIFDVDKFAVHDGPGIRTTVFLKGCPLRCLWCHSPESWSPKPQLVFHESRCVGCGNCVEACPQGAQWLSDYIGDNNRPQRKIDREKCVNCGACTETCYAQALRMCGKEMTAEEVVNDVAKNEAFFRNSGGGVTLSGGEPTMQPRFAHAILKGLKERDIHTAMETTGHTSWANLQSLAPYVDLFLYDLKQMDDANHKAQTGVSNTLILRNLKRLATLGKDIQARVPVIPTRNDDDANIIATCACAQSVGVERIAFLPYNPSTPAKYEWIGKTYPLQELEPPSSEAMERMMDVAESFGLQAQMGG
jgi:pyruvate formate lyase activating enzyme